MPRITTYALDQEVVNKASVPMTDRISRLLEVPREYVVIQVNRDSFVRDGHVVAGDPFVEVCMFEREQEKEDEVARIITGCLREAGCPALDVYLTHLVRRRYFENGEHF